MSLFPAYTEACSLADKSASVGSEASSVDHLVDGFSSAPVQLSSAAASPSQTDAVDNAIKRAGDDFGAHKKRRHKKQESTRKSRKRKKADRLNELSQLLENDRLSQRSEKSDSPESSAGRRTGIFFSADDFVRPSRAFFTDRRCDRTNLAFSVTHYSDRAFFRRQRTWRPLGTASGDSAASGKERRYYSRRMRRLLRQTSSPAPQSANFDDWQHCNFVPFTSDEQSSVSKAADVCELTTARDFNEQLAAQPNNSQLWIRFVAAQRQLLSSEGAAVGRQQLYDRQLAIVERALGSCASCEQLQLLRLQLLQQLLATTDDQKMEREWQRILVLWPNRTSVWNRYLHYVEHRRGGNLTATLAAYLRCLRRMHQFQCGTVLSHSAPSHLTTFITSLTYRVCVILRDAGYTERAIAIYQALLELNFSQRSLDGASDTVDFDKHRQKAWRDALLVFETFWDSRLPRLGERGARGWREELRCRDQDVPGSAQNHSAPAEHEDHEQKILDDPRLSVAEKWLQLESLRESCQWLPWQERGREDECEDMERIVSFDDVNQYMYPVFRSADYVRLVLGLVSLLIPADWHLYIDLFKQYLCQPAAAAGESSWWPWKLPLSLMPAESAVYSANSAAAVNSNKLDFITRLLEYSWSQLSAPADRQLLQLVYLRVQLSRGSEQRRAIRQLLRTESGSVPLYIEYACGQPTASAAVSILETTLRQPVVASGSARFQLLCRLLRMRTAAALAGPKHGSLLAQLRPVFLKDMCLVLQLPESTAAAAKTQQLRVVHQLSQQLDRPAVCAAAAADLLSCLAWAQLVTGTRLQCAANVFTAFIASHREQQISPIMDSGVILYSQCEFIQLASSLLNGAVHTTSASCKHLLKMALSSAVKLCPEDPRLALLAAKHNSRESLLWWLHARDDVSGDVTSQLFVAAAASYQLMTSYRSLGENDDVTERRLAVNAARVRRYLSRLLEDDEQLQENSDLWRLALYTEQKINDKGVDLLCHRAVQSCPAEKRLYLTLLTSAAAADRNAVSRCCHLLARGGVRVRTPPEELDLLLQLEPEMMASDRDDDKDDVQPETRPEGSDEDSYCSSSSSSSSSSCS